MSILSRFFRPKPERPFVEYPDGRLRSATDALLEGIRSYRSQGGGRRALISWQGQGSRPDSYHIVEARLEGECLGFDDLQIDMEKVCHVERLNYAPLKGRTPSELRIGSFSDTDLAALLQVVFTRHLGVRPFEDTGDYCVGFEYEKRG